MLETTVPGEVIIYTMHRAHRRGSYCISDSLFMPMNVVEIVMNLTFREWLHDVSPGLLFREWLHDANVNYQMSYTMIFY